MNIRRVLKNLEALTRRVSELENQLAALTSAKPAAKPRTAKKESK